MTRTLRIIVSLLACLGLPAQAGQTRSVEIDIEPVVVLRCQDSISLDIGAADILQALDRPAMKRARTRAFPSRGMMVAALGDVAAGTGGVPVITMPLERGCMVRGLSRGEGFVVTVHLGPEPRLLGEDGHARIDVLRARGRMSDGGGAHTGRFSIPQSRVRLDTWTALDFLLDLDVSRAGASGTYHSDSNGIFVVDVSTP